MFIFFVFVFRKFWEAVRWFALMYVPQGSMQWAVRVQNLLDLSIVIYGAKIREEILALHGSVLLDNEERCSMITASLVFLAEVTYCGCQ